MSGRFADKVVVATGATQGIGNAIVHRFLAEGARVVGGARSAGDLARMEQELGDRFVGVATDATREKDVERLVAMATERFGTIDVGVNVVGGAGIAPVIDTREEDFDQLIALSLKSVLYSIKHQARQMIAQGTGGAIVNISSINARLPIFGGGGYACAKAAVDMLTRNAALELARHKIRVNVLLPGLIGTPATAAFIADPALNDDFMRRIAMARPGLVEEVAAPTLFLASDEAAYITGASLIVDGGWSLTGYPDLDAHLGITSGGQQT